MNVEDVAEMLREFSPDGDGEAAKSRELTMVLLTLAQDPFSRDLFTPGLLIASFDGAASSGAANGAAKSTARLVPERTWRDCIGTRQAGDRPLY